MCISLLTELWMNLFFGNQVTTAGGTYSDLGSMYTDYTYRQALKHFFLRYFPIFNKNHSDSAYSAGTCNLDMASGAIHPTTGQLPNDANCKIVTITIFKNVRLIEMLQANTATSWLWTTPGCRSTTMETREPLPSAALISPSAQTLWCLAQWHSLIVDILNVSVLCHEDLTWKK